MNRTPDRFRAKPRAVVLPETAAEVIETVRLCYQAEVPFVARGSGTSLSGGSLPIEDGLVIALTAEPYFTARPPGTAGGGRTGRHQSGCLQSGGSLRPLLCPDPSSQLICTIGAMWPLIPAGRTALNMA